eukprot:TRINITY_DN21606_c0_g1_i2.p1 TRINITY_DN21606_c0_g1~~TRINITY_DN21606_c0_g1_i2.p1  ORF type:complete len:480 (+),score=94.70 TRINITY_DN21606_c0_g1_i2:27-1442(+)
MDSSEAAIVLSPGEEAFLSACRRFWESIILPLCFLYGVSNFMMGISLRYMFLCFWLEMKLRIWNLFFGSSSSAQPQASQSCPKLSTEEKALTLRGIKVPTSREYSARGQSLPPTKVVSKIFPVPPAGEELECSKASSSGKFWQMIGRAKEVQQKVKPGMALLEIAEMVENASSALVGFDPKHPMKCGWAFPTGLSLNEIAAHDTVNPGDPPRWLRPNDVLKLDFGVHVEGHILDCAFTMAFDPVHDELMKAVQDATEEGLRHVGVDALTSEVGARIREVMEAAEVHRPDGKVLRVKAIKNLTGHSIAPYKIHSGKSLPSTNNGSSERMLAGELWAVETFGSVGGVGYVANRGNCSHFMRPDSSPPSSWQKSMLSAKAQDLLEIIDKRFSTMAFCPRWIVQEATRIKSPLMKGGGNQAQPWWTRPLDELCTMGVVNKYPPLADIPGSFTAQYEHTVLLGSRSKEILTRGSDY